MADELPRHTAWLRTLPCCACTERPPSEVHHRVGAGMAIRSHDASAIPLCRQCHRDYHDHRGMFKTMDRAQKLIWHDEKLKEVNDKIMDANAEDEEDERAARELEWEGIF